MEHSGAVPAPESSTNAAGMPIEQIVNQEKFYSVLEAEMKKIENFTQEEVKKYLNSFYKTPSFHDVKKLIQIRSIKQLYHYLRDIFIRIHSKRTVIKDPIAIMSAEWIYENFDIDVVVLIS